MVKNPQTLDEINQLEKELRRKKREILNKDSQKIGQELKRIIGVKNFNEVVQKSSIENDDQGHPYIIFPIRKSQASKSPLSAEKIHAYQDDNQPATSPSNTNNNPNENFTTSAQNFTADDDFLHN